MKRLNTYSLLIYCSIAILTLTMIQCKKEEIPVVEVKTYEATDITASSVTIEGEIISAGGATITKKGICISKNSDPTPVDGQILSSSTSNEFSVEINDLKANNKFYYRAFAVSSAGVFYGEEYFFSTVTGLPEIKETTDVTDITPISAVTGGYILRSGGESTVRGVCWSTSSEPTINDSITEDGSGTSTGEFISNITGLDPKTTYYVRAYATNSHGTVYGDEKQFRTLNRPWTQLGDFAGVERKSAVGFAINGKGYFGLGLKWEGGSPSTLTYYYDFWEYDPTSDTWSQKANFKGNGRRGSYSFVINDLGYVGGGNHHYSDDGGYSYRSDYQYDLWEYNPVNNTWNQKSDSPNSTENGVCFEINGKGYFGVGITYSWGSTIRLYEYDPVSDSWTEKAEFPGNERYGAVSFSVDNLGFIGLGTTGYAKYNDFWEYNPSTNQWVQRSDFPGAARGYANGFCLNANGYVVGGSSVDGVLNELWKYDPTTDSWIQMTSFKGEERSSFVTFSIGNKAYLGTGENGYEEFLNDFWEYDPSQEED